MKGFTGILLVCLCLVTISQARAADYYVEAVADTVTVYVQPGNTGITINPQDIEFCDEFLGWIKLANAGRAYMTVVTSNDDTEWRLLQLLEQDSKFKDVDFAELNLNFDTMAKGGRQTAADQILTQAGLEPHAQINWRFVRDDKCYFKIYGVAIKQRDYLSVQPVDTSAIFKQINGLLSSATKIWTMGWYVGLSTTRHTVAPTAGASIYYQQKLMLRGQGVHSLWLRQDRDYFGSDEPTFERAWNVAAGYRCVDDFWLSLGWYSEENILDAGLEAGDNLTWLDAGELGLNYIRDNLALQLGLTYGHEKDYDKEMTTNFGLRFAVMVGNTWGW